jgi:hypothetical protein
MNRPDPVGSVSSLIDGRIKELGDWRGRMLAKVRQIIHEADPGIVEEWKWMGTPVWSHGGIVCTGETYRNVVKMTFHKGAALNDPSGLFNSSLDGNVRRAIDIHEGEKINEAALKDLIRAAVALNLEARSKSKPRERTPGAPAAPIRKAARVDSMISINRTAIVVRPGQLFLDWLHRVDPASRELTLEDLRLEPAIYLLPECANDEEVRGCLAGVCGRIFEAELDGWYRVPSSWPRRRDLDAFERWFEWRSHSELIDLCGDPLLREEF